MRNEETDRLGDQLHQAFLKSGMSPQDFTFYCYENRAAAVDYEAAPDNCFLIVVDDEIYTYYYTNGRWYCKI